MTANKFRVFARRVGIRDVWVKLTLEGVDSDGTLNFSDSSGSSYSFSPEGWVDLNREDLVIPEPDVQNADSNLVSAANKLGENAYKSEYSSPVANRIDESVKQIFQAVVRSAE